MRPIRPIRSLQQRAVRQLFPDPDTLIRPEFVRPAQALFAASTLLLLLPHRPLAAFFAPAFVFGCRYHELARLPRVRCSRWAFLLALGAAIVGGLWSCAEPAAGPGRLLGLALACGALLVGAHLFAAQRRLHAEQQRGAWLDSPDDDAPRWACGGWLAILPVLFVVGLLSGLTTWRAPAALLWGLSGGLLLALQLRCHPWFPRLAAGWLVLWLALETCATFGSGTALDEESLASYAAVAVLTGTLLLRLLFGVRARDTFRGPAGAHAAAPTVAAPAHQASA